MRIEHNYLKELLEENEHLDREPFHDESSTPLNFPEPDAEFVMKLTSERNDTHTEKRAADLCMSLSEFKSLSRRAHELAARIGMDYALDRQAHFGSIILTTLSFDLFKDETPELTGSFVLLFSRADRLCVSPLTKYGKSVISLTFSYDLDE